MTHSATSSVPAADTGLADSVRLGWRLDKPSWPFHRSIFKLIGRALEFGEYTSIRGQIEHGAAELIQFGDDGYRWRAVLRDGAAVDVIAMLRQRGSWRGWDLLRAARPLHDKPQQIEAIAVAPAEPAPPPPPQAAPPEPVPAPAAPPAAPPIRPSTLALGARSAALLAQRLRHTGVRPP